MASKRSKNPNNSESFLYKALTRLFSGPIVNYRRQNYRKLKRHQLDKYKTKFRSVSGKEFKKSTHDPFNSIYSGMTAAMARSERYVDFDQMEYEPIIAAALDIYADEMTSFTSFQKMLTVDCHNFEIKDIVENLFYSILNIDFNAFGWSRTLCKNGDFFLYLDIDEKMGIKNVIGIPPQEIERLEGEDKTNPNYVQYQWNSAGLTLENWQIAHFRILGHDKWAPYGTSVLDPVRRIWRQLNLQEDAMMAYRIVRSPERRVFKIDVGGIPEDDVEQYMERIITNMKRNQVVDSDSARIDLRYNPMSIDEDYFIPVRGGQGGTTIESLPGGSYTGDIDDVKYLRDKLLAGLKIPHSYLIMTEGADEDKTTLAQKDIRFARTIQRLQRSLISELEKIAIVHLYVLGFRGKDLTSFKLKMPSPSKIAELQELEHWRTKFDIASSATEGFLSKRTIAKKFLELSDEEFLRNIREMYFDKKLDADLETIAAAAEEAISGAGSEEDFLGGAEEDLGLDAEPEEAPEEEETLLAAPGKRREEGYLTPRSKGKRYVPVDDDKRSMGARRRSYQSKFSKEMSSTTDRNIFKGTQDLRALSRGIYEEYETNYKKSIISEKSEKQSKIMEEQEKSLFKDRDDIRNIVERLNNLGENGLQKKIAQIKQKDEYLEIDKDD